MVREQKPSPAKPVGNPFMEHPITIDFETMNCTASSSLFSAPGTDRAARLGACYGRSGGESRSAARRGSRRGGRASSPDPARRGRRHRRRPERPGASCVRRRGRPRPGREVGPLAPISCRRRGPRGRVRGCAGGYRPTGWGYDLTARAILVRRILDVPLDSGGFPGLAAFARSRARLPFSARPQPTPGAHSISRALVGSVRGVDLIHRDAGGWLGEG